MKRGSSTRLMLAPRTSGTASVVISASPALRGDGRAGPDGLGRVADRRDDVLVAGTAAEVALDGMPDLVVGRIRVVLEQVDRGHDHAGGAEPALEAVLLPERGLHGVQRVAVGEALDGQHLGAIGLNRQPRTGLDRPPVD